MKVDREKVTDIDRRAESVSVPFEAKCIGELACLYGSLYSLDISYTKIIIIEKFAFSHCFFLKEIIFPRSLREIWESAFDNCKYIEKISFPNDSDLRKIGKKSFRLCSELMSFDFPPLLESIGREAFFGCDNLRNIDLSLTKVSVIGKKAFQFCYALIKLPSTIKLRSILNNSMSKPQLEEGIQNIHRDNCGYFNFGNFIFQNTDIKKKHFLIRRGVERIGQYCFNSCALVSLTIPVSVVEISKGAFMFCNSLCRIEFSKNSRLREIGKKAFFTRCFVKSIIFPASLKILRDNSFSMFDELVKVTFPNDSQLEIIESPFPNTGIKALSLPSSVREIFNITHRMEELESIYINNDLFRSNDARNAIFSSDGSELVCVIQKLKNFKIPENVKVIKKQAFSYSMIAELTIPGSVETIEDETFRYCEELKTIIIEGNGLKSLSCSALNNLDELIINNDFYIKRDDGVIMSSDGKEIVFVPKKLTELVIDSNVEAIYSYAFAGSNIKSLKLPKSLKRIHEDAFYYSNIECIEFEEGTELDFIRKEAFFNSKNKAIKLPLIKEELGNDVFRRYLEILEFPPNFNPAFVSSWSTCNTVDLLKIICPRSSIKVLTQLDFHEYNDRTIEVEIKENC